MKQKTRNVTVLVMTCIMVMVFTSSKSYGTNDTGVKLSNVIGTGLSTVINGLITGKVNSFSDGLKTFLYGSAAGYGFYQSKKMIGHGKVTAGLLLAQLSASVAHNVSRGESPFAYLGYSCGIARIQLATPLAKNPSAVVGLDLSLREIINLGLAVRKGGRAIFKNGMISFEDVNREGNVRGWTRGLFPGVIAGAPSQVYNHEMIHVAQNLQLQSQFLYEPYLRANEKYEGSKTKFFRFNGFRLDLVGTLGDLSGTVQSYEDHWREIEAYHFTSR